MNLDLTNVIAMIRSSRLALGLGVFGAFGLVAALLIATGSHPEPQERLEKAWPVSVMLAQPGTVRPSLVTFGRVESRQVAKLKTSVTAPVMSLLVSEGEWVNSGDSLVALEQQELGLALTMAEADHRRRLAQLNSVKTENELAIKLTSHHQTLQEISESKLERNRDLFKNQMISDEVLDEARRLASERTMTLEQHLARVLDFPNRIAEAEAAVTEAAAMRDQAQLNLEQTSIRAPFRGRIMQLHVAPGDRVFQGTTVLEIADYDQLEVRATVPAEQGAKLRQQLNSGAEVKAVGDINGDQLTFVLDRMSGNVKPGHAGIDAFFRPQGNERLDIGLVVNLQVTLPPEQDVVVLPVQSLYENDRIYRVVDNRLQGVDVVRVGDHLNDQGEYRVLVRSNMLGSADKLITTQLPRAIHGLLVEPIDASQFEQAIAAEVD